MNCTIISIKPPRLNWLSAGVSDNCSSEVEGGSDSSIKSGFNCRSSVISNNCSSGLEEEDSD